MEKREKRRKKRSDNETQIHERRKTRIKVAFFSNQIVIILNGRFMQLKCLCVHYYIHLGNISFDSFFFLRFSSIPFEMKNKQVCDTDKTYKKNKTTRKIKEKRKGNKQK